MKLKALLLILWSGASLLTARAQETPGARPQPDPLSFRFQHFSPADGLSDLRVTSILQDHYGYMWFGTWDGLNRYDGYSFTVYRHDPLDEGSLSDGYVEELIEDQQGRLWVGLLGGGLDRYDREAEVFVHYRNEPDDPSSLCSDVVQALHVTRDGALWVGGGGALGRYEPDRDAFTCFRPNPDDPEALASGNGPFVIYEDRAGVLWVGKGFYDPNPTAQGGLHRFNPPQPGNPSGRGSFTRYQHDPDQPQGLPNNAVMALFEDRRGRFWVGANGFDGSGLALMDRNAETFRPFRYDSDEPERLSGPAPVVGRASAVTAILEDQSGRLWIGGIGGLVVHDPASGKTLRIRDIQEVWEIHEDRSGTIWIGCGGGECLVKATPAAGSFTLLDEETSTGNPSVFALANDSQGRLWYGLGDMLAVRDRRESGDFDGGGRHIGDRLPREVVTAILPDSRGNLWVGFNRGGLCRRSSALGPFECLPLGSGDASGLASDRVSSLAEGQDGTIWIGLMGGGLSAYDPASRTFRRYQSDPLDPSSLDYLVRKIHQTRDQTGALWLELGDVRGSLYRFLPEERRMTPYLPGTSVNALFQDSQNRVWLGTDRQGLCLFDQASGSCRFFGTDEGLEATSVFSVTEDGLGRLWLGTASGLMRFDPASETFRLYDRTDGLPETFLRGPAVKGIDGRLTFGCRAGLLTFRPEDFGDDTYPPSVHITRLRVTDRSSAERGSRDWVLSNDASTVRLSYDQRDVVFEYVGLQYNNPAKNRYRSRLIGFDGGWSEETFERRANYTNLTPGTYTFQVIASNSDGVWNEEGASLTLTILPPWWRTWWAYGIYLLFAIGSVVQGHRWQHARVVAREREAARERELAQAKEIERQHAELTKAHETLKATQAQLVQSEKLASLGQLTAGIAHEIQNPLNFVNNFAELSGELADDLRESLAASRGRVVEDVEGGLSEIAIGIKANAGQIAKHGKRAEAIVKSMMAHATAGSGERVMVEVNDFVAEYVRLASGAFVTRRPDVEVRIAEDYDPASGSVRMAPQELGRALVNILSNAFEAVDARQRVEHPERMPRTSPAQAQRPLQPGEPYVPTVTVTTRRTDAGVEIRIADNGPGIPTEIRERVFEPFFTTKPTGEGTGLGLSLAHDIVVQGHGGKLTVETEQGEGAAFVITLPAVEVTL